MRGEAAAAEPEAAPPSAVDAGVAGATAAVVPQVEIGPLEAPEPEAECAVIGIDCFSGGHRRGGNGASVPTVCGTLRGNCCAAIASGGSAKNGGAKSGRIWGQTERS